VNAGLPSPAASTLGKELSVKISQEASCLSESFRGKEEVLPMPASEHRIVQTMS